MLYVKSISALLLGGGLAVSLSSSPDYSRIGKAESFRAYGRSVAIAGEFAFVGEPQVVVGGRGGGRGGGPPAAGVVHIYRNSGATWNPAGQLLSATTTGGDGFGAALAADATTLLVGQVSPPPVGTPAGRGGQAAVPAGADTATGSVQVFKRGADMKWTPGGSLPTSAARGAQFGLAIAMAGDLALVGAPGDAGGGAVYVFSNASGAWVQETEQVAPQNLPDNSQFGGAVAVKGDRVIVGAPATNFTPTVLPNPLRDSLLIALSNTPAGPARDAIVTSLASLAPAGRGGFGGGGRGGANIGLGAGMVLTYERASFGSWRMISTLAPFDFGNVAFGSAIAVVGEELWIGAPGSDLSGRIYRTHADKEGGWAAMTKLGVDTLEAGAQWASSFAVSGNTAIVGMPGDGGGGGTVAILGRKGDEWTLKSLIMPPIPERFAAVSGKEVQCENGLASAFECGNTSLLSFMPISAIGGKRGVGLSGSWGWTDPVTGRDISIIGRTDGTAFVDVTDPVRPRYLGDLPRTKGSNASSWREMKTYKNYALIVSDGSGDHHGIQIFDLTRLRKITKPQRFTEDAHFDAGSIHDIAVNETSGYAYAVGTASGGERCSGGSLMINMKNPLKPEFAGCFADVGTGRAKGGYTHDILCVIYKGPDKRYTGHEICMASNETTVSIQDVTDKKNVKVLSHADYPTPGYTHQGWFTEDQRYWFLNDELDEASGLGKSAEGTRTLIFDVADLQQPVMVKEHIGPTHAIDHNLYVKGNRMYQSNYKAGLRILDITDPKNPKEVGYLDTTPGGVNDAVFAGSWNNYPFFKNGAIGVVSMGEGFFMVKDNTHKPVP